MTSHFSSLLFCLLQDQEGDADQVNCQLIRNDHLKVIKGIGEGHYGLVKLGEWTQNNGNKVQSTSS